MINLHRFTYWLDYEPETGHLKWKRRPCQSVREGDIAGRKTNTRYIRVGIDGKQYMAHRIAFFIMTGRHPLPGLEVDHINHDTHDNRWCNLREVTRSENLKNRRWGKKP